MPTIRNYNIEVSVVVRVRDTEKETTVIHIEKSERQKANSYNPLLSIPKVVEGCIDELKGEISPHIRFVHHSETSLAV